MGAAVPLQTPRANFRIQSFSNGRPGHELRNQVRAALQRGERAVVVNCEGWNSLDFPILSSLIQCASACREHGASFEIANMSSSLLADVRALQLEARLGLPD